MLRMLLHSREGYLLLKCCGVGNVARPRCLRIAIPRYLNKGWHDLKQIRWLESDNTERKPKQFLIIFVLCILSLW